MSERRHGRYYAQEIVVETDADLTDRIQDALDAGDRQEWHLAGVADTPGKIGVILFWDTARPSFGRTS